MNRVILTGRITKDPEIRYSSQGIAVLSFSLAVDRQTRDASGARQADFFNCTAFRNQAEFISRYVKKGYMLCVEGRLHNRSYQAQDGTMRYATDIICDQVENLTPRQQTNEYLNQDNHQMAYQQPTYQAPKPSPMPQDNLGPQNFPNTFEQPSYANDDNVDSMNVEDDDLPF